MIENIGQWVIDYLIINPHLIGWIVIISGGLIVVYLGVLIWKLSRR